MAYQFTTISENDWGNGIDQQSAENAIKPGFVEDLLNGNPQAEGYISKRVGYQGVAGNIPVRVTRVDYAGTELCFTLDPTVNMVNVASCPIYVKGKLSVTSGGADFDAGADNAKYYTSFTLDNTINLPSSSNSLVIPAAQHGQGTPYFLPRLYEKGITENSLFHVDSIVISKLTSDLTIGYTYSPAVGDPTDITAYILYSKRSTNSYIPLSTTSIASGVTQTLTISASTHAQSISNNLLVELWQDDGTNLTLLKPDEITVSTTGTVAITVTNNNSSTIEVFPVITATAEGNTKTSSLDYNNRQLIVTNLETDFVGASIYTKNASTGLLQELIPDSISINASTRTLTAEFGFNNQGYADAIVANGESTFVIYYENLNLISNKICVTANTAAVGTVIDQAPQLTIWGLNHTEIYSDNPVASRSGWVTHLDSYKAPAVNTVVAGLGGNLFSIYPVSPAIALYPNINGRTTTSLASQSIGPSFWGLTDSPSRTAGYCKFSGGEENWARVTEVTWISNNTVEYTLSTPGRINTSTPISFSTDRLTVEGCGWSINDGTFVIASAPDYSNSNEIKVRVINTAIDCPDFNETDSGGLAGIFTSTVSLAASSSFITNDRLVSDLFNEGTDLRVVESTGSTLTIGNIVDPYTLPSTLLIVGQREGRVLPLRTRSGSASVTNVVTGDMCSYNGLNRLLRVKRVNADSNRNVSLSADGVTLTVTLTSGNTAGLNVGQRVLFTQNEVFNGEHVISEILSLTQFTVESKLTGSGTAVLVGRTVELDETILLTDDRNNDITFSVPYRWQPAESPVAPDSYTFSYTKINTTANTITLTGHGLTNNTPVTLYSSSPPSPLASNTTYYVVNSTTNTIQLALNIAGLAIDLTTQGSDTSNILIVADKASLKQTYISHFPAGGYGEQAILRSAMSSTNLYLANGQDQVMKFDGEHVYRAGLPRWQPHAFITVDEDPSNLFIPGKIAVDNPPVLSSARNGNVFTIPAAKENVFKVGDKIYDTYNHEIYTISAIKTDNDTPAVNAYITVDRNITSASGSHNLSRAFYYRYYFRLNAIDANNNTIASAVTGYQDNIVLIEHSSQIRIRLIGFPAWDNYDYDKLEVQVYRTKLDDVAPFYRVASVQLSYANNTGYVDIVDTTPDINLTLNELDRVSTSQEGEELGTQWAGPLRSKYITSAANKLILGNIETDPQLDIIVQPIANAAALTTADFHGTKLLFRKDSNDNGTVTDNLNRMTFEFRDSTVAPLSVTGVTNGGGTTSFTVTTATTHGLLAGDWVYLTLKTSESDWSYTSYDQGTDELVGTVAHNYTDGQRIVLYSNSPPATSPAGQLVDTGVYYAITTYVGSTSTRLKLATTLANALAGTAINLTGSGSTGNLEPHTQIRMQYVGWWQVASEDAVAKTFTINHFHCNPDGTPYTPAAGKWEVDIAVKASAGTDIPVWLGQDNAMEAITSTFAENIAVDRLSRAINASQRLCRTSGFEPWLIAGSGADYNRGQITITQPKSLSTITELVLPTFNKFLIFVNGIQRRSRNSISTYSIRYPSRILASYENYPELFNNPTAVDPKKSTSVIDVNSADGQEITGIIPFFGESAFGAALRSGVIVVFKTNSIYVVDLAEKAAGRNPVQKVESQGLGCTAPYSIANTRDGIIFANESGIYKLTRQLAVEYVGRKVERVWRNRVTSDALQLAFGHHYGTGSQYKISVPLDGGTAPGDLLVYSHVREYQSGIGAWGRYSHSPAIGWCNLQSDAYFASTDGRVYSIRKAGDNTDYRDDDRPIPFELILRAMDFGDGGIRKIISHIITKFRVLGDAAGTVLSTAADLNDNFVNADNFRIESPVDNSTGLSDPNNVKVQTIRFSIDNRKLVFLQVRFTNSTIDEPVEITEVSVRVAGMTDKGITSAART